MNFPIFKTKVDSLSQKFNLTDLKQRQEYFQAKAGNEIARLRKYLEDGNTFLVYLMGPKNSGKGTYAKMFKEVVSPEKVSHFSVGDMIRSFDEIVQDSSKAEIFKKEFSKFYRGAMSLEEIIEKMQNRSTKFLLPTELILALVKMEISKQGKKAVFIDGFPRNLDQISYSLYFRDVIGFRDDPDIFVLIDVPESVIDERIKYRLICPKCQTSRNFKLLATQRVDYDAKEGKFKLFCDNPQCSGDYLMSKEGDEEGIAPILERIKTDKELMKQALGFYGIPKVFLRNSVPVDKANDYIDDYEITPEFVYELENEKVAIKERPWQIADDQGVVSYSLMPQPVVLSLIKQIVEALGI